MMRKSVWKHFVLALSVLFAVALFVGCSQKSTDTTGGDDAAAPADQSAVTPPDEAPAEPEATAAPTVDATPVTPPTETPAPAPDASADTTTPSADAPADAAAPAEPAAPAGQ